jgi:Ran GTPase-activating protein (RanGAP) involved in mRNA processing and transport
MSERRTRKLKMSNTKEKVGSRGSSCLTSNEDHISSDSPNSDDADSNKTHGVQNASHSNFNHHLHIGKSGSSGKVDLRKEYNRFCKLYSSEPLDIVAGPLEKASYRHDTCVELDLKGKGLRGVDCIALGKILSTNFTIHLLDLSDCLLLPQGFQALLDGLAKNCHLRILQLRGNNIQSGMVENLGLFLKANKTLKQLLLEWNCIGTSKPSFQVFCGGLSANKALEVLDLRNNRIQDDSGVDVANALMQNTSLMDLDLRWNSLGIQGAKALWECLKSNKNLRKMDLNGNFVPEEIVQYIQSTLSTRGEKEAIIEDLSARTNILTRQLQKTEEEYKSEISSMVSVFEEEETELKELIREGQQELGRVEKELLNEKAENASCLEQLNQLHRELEASQEQEAVLKEALQIKQEKITALEASLKSLGTEIGSQFDAKISKVAKEAEGIQQENDKLSQELEEANISVKDKLSEISILQSRITSLKEASKRSETQFEERLRKERENWHNWKAEVESNEQQETKRLESQLLDLQRTMQDHVKSIEAKRLEAEEESNRLRIVMLTSRTESEESLTRLRNTLNEEHAQATQGLLSQIESLKKTSEALELQGKRLDSVIRKMESDQEVLTKQNEHWRLQSQNLQDELQETREKGQVQVQKVKNDCRTLESEVAREQEANKALRSQVLEMQEQIAVLSMRLNRALQEKQSEGDYWKGQVDRRDEELKRIKEEDMRRAALLHDAFLVYMKSTSAATGLPVPQTCFDFLKSVGIPTDINLQSQGSGGDAGAVGSISKTNNNINISPKCNKNAQGDGVNK